MKTIKKVGIEELAGEVDGELLNVEEGDQHVDHVHLAKKNVNLSHKLQSSLEQKFLND